MRKIVCVIIVTLFCTGCTGSGAPAAVSSSSTAAAQVASQPSPAATVTAVAVPNVTPTGASVQVAPPDPAAAPAIAVSRAALAGYLGVAPATVELTSSEARQWTDSSYGCPDPDRAYSQIVIPGYLLTFNAGAQAYTIHTSQVGRPLILCDNGNPLALDQSVTAPVQKPSPVAQAPLPSQTPGGFMNDDMQRMLDVAKDKLAERVAADASSIDTIVSEAVTWPDGGLGCPEPGRNYTQALIDGFRFVFETDGQQYELHTDARNGVVFCNTVSLEPLPSTQPSE